MNPRRSKGDDTLSTLSTPYSHVVLIHRAFRIIRGRVAYLHTGRTPPRRGPLETIESPFQLNRVDSKNGGIRISNPLRCNHHHHEVKEHSGYDGNECIYYLNLIIGEELNFVEFLLMFEFLCCKDSKELEKIVETNEIYFHFVIFKFMYGIIFGIMR